MTSSGGPTGESSDPASGRQPPHETGGRELEVRPDAIAPLGGPRLSAEGGGRIDSAGGFGEGTFSLRGSSDRMRIDRLFRWLCVGIASMSVLILVFLLVAILIQGIPSLSPTLVSGSPEPNPAEAGMRPAIFGTIWVCALCGAFTLPIGIATAILLEEFKPRARWSTWLFGLIQLNISNLAGVPSVVYGILGLTAFVSMFGLFADSGQPGEAAFEVGAVYFDQFFSEGDRVILIPVESRADPIAQPRDGMVAFDAQMRPVEVNVVEPGERLPSDPEVLAYTIFRDSQAGRISNKSWYYFRLPFGRGVIAGALTLMLVVLPIIIVSAQESLRAVPSSLREGAAGLGATRWQVVWNVTLPAAIPGIMTGSILAMSRAIGETAPILIIAGIVYIRNAPQNLMDDFTVMPLQIYNWTSRPQPEFHHIAAAGIILLLLILLSFNALAVWIRHKTHRPLS